MASRIEDYALIGDCLSAALVARDGSIDWACFPRFDSGASFSALLGTEQHGRWLIAPSGGIKAIRRHYRGDTLVLETEYETADGTAAIIDFMPERGEAPDIVRIVEDRRGSVAMRYQLIVRFDYGLTIPWARRREGCIHYVAGSNCLRLQSLVETRGESLTTVAEFTVTPGEKVPFVLTWFPSYRPAPRLVDPETSLRRTEERWRKWVARLQLPESWPESRRDAVVRSIITLKALTYEPTGGILAAATTSLPESPGSVRNWDYRYCWLRDATFSLFALLQSGFHEEAQAWQEWLLRAVAGKPSDTQIMYSITGDRRLPEEELPWLPGYENSRPVRVGNAAQQQLQLDVYGEVMDVLHRIRQAGIQPDPESWQVQLALLEFLESAWKEPDRGIWEVRGPRRHYTHSKVMAWVAFDRAVRDAEEYGLEGPADRWRRERDAIRSEVLERGYDKDLGCFTQHYGSKILDASLLRIPLVGFLPAIDPRMRRTLAAIERGLLRDGLVERYPARPEVDSLPPGEGVFLPCSFWLADNLALTGRRDDALHLFERLLSLRNDVGLLSEEYDPGSRRLLGNFPQAFTHVALVNTARNLSEETRGPADEQHHD
jgi:GH15 family glucan-1,4-alpha-glucosidase